MRRVMRKPDKHKKRSYTTRKLLTAGILATSLTGGVAMAENHPIRLGMPAPTTAPGAQKPIKLGMPLPGMPHGKDGKPILGMFVPIKHDHKPLIMGMFAPRPIGPDGKPMPLTFGAKK
jgi:hypothetical protein